MAVIKMEILCHAKKLLSLEIDFFGKIDITSVRSRANLYP
jgi:hypothetical protein